MTFYRLIFLSQIICRKTDGKNKKNCKIFTLYKCFFIFTLLQFS